MSPSDTTVSVPADKLQELTSKAEKFQALIDGGVEDWEGYHDAMAGLVEDEPAEDTDEPIEDGASDR